MLFLLFISGLGTIEKRKKIKRRKKNKSGVGRNLKSLSLHEAVERIPIRIYAYTNPCLRRTSLFQCNLAAVCFPHSER